MRRQNWWTRFAIWRQGGVGIAALAAGTLQALDQYEIAKKLTWLHDETVLFWSVVAAGGLVLLNTVGDVVVQQKAFAGEAERVDIHKTVMGALAAVSKTTEVVITDLGANVFVVKQRRFRKGDLLRIERIRLIDYPAMSDVVWTEGKGVIGLCWQNKRTEHVNWTPIARRWAGKPITDRQWDGIPERHKAGFSKADFMAMVGKYAEIVAVPVKNEQGEVIGVLAIDRVWRKDEAPRVLLKDHEIENLVTTAAVVLRSVLAGR